MVKVGVVVDVAGGGVFALDSFCAGVSHFACSFVCFVSGFCTAIADYVEIAGDEEEVGASVVSWGWFPI